MAAAKSLTDVLIHEKALTSPFTHFETVLDSQEIGLYKQLCFGVLRQYRSLDAKASQLLNKPIRKKDFDVYALILIGLYQLDFLRTPSYAAIDSCVKAALSLKKPWAKGLINACLRQYQKKNPLKLTTNEATEHPDWLLEKLQSAWPDHLTAILAGNNTAPPLCLRINNQAIAVDDFLNLLNAEEIAYRDHIDNVLYLDNYQGSITKIPGFKEGFFAIQDEAAQQAAQLLDCQNNQRVLDSCAAPGGKTCHLLQSADNLTLLAIDKALDRLDKVHQNLERFSLKAKVKCADILNLDQWWDGKSFDRILCDVPCSATGVIRRHPDIKWLRKAADIEQLVHLQQEILEKIWHCLKPNGILLYTTCSVLPEENSEVIADFLKNHTDAMLIDPVLPSHISSVPTRFGIQLLPKPLFHDGFYFAKLTKVKAN